MSFTTSCKRDLSVGDLLKLKNPPQGPGHQSSGSRTLLTDANGCQPVSISGWHSCSVRELVGLGCRAFPGSRQGGILPGTPRYRARPIAGAWPGPRAGTAKLPLFGRMSDFSVQHMVRYPWWKTTIGKLSNPLIITLPGAPATPTSEENTGRSC